MKCRTYLPIQNILTLQKMTATAQTRVTSKNLTQQPTKEHNTSNTTTMTEPTKGIRSARPHMYHSAMTQVGNGAIGAAGGGRV